MPFVLEGVKASRVQYPWVSELENRTPDLEVKGFRVLSGEN